MIRIGIIGCGGIAKQHVEHILQAPGQAKVMAALDIAPENAQWLLDLTGAIYCHDLESTLDHIDAAIVTTPPNSRVEVIRELAAAGKTIFCEKPLAGTVEDARAIADIISSAGVPFMMGFMRRWHAPYIELKKVAESNHLGRPLQFYRRRLGYHEPSEGNWRISQQQLTGVTIESASHDIDLLRWLGGEVTEASGEVIESRGDLPGYDDMMVATLRFASGAIGMLQIAWSALLSDNAVGIYGTEKAAVIDGEGLWRSDRLMTRTRTGEAVDVATFPEEDSNDMGYANQMRAFIALASGESVDHPDVFDGLATVEIAHQILASSHGR